jgi:hypothetical protein
LLAKIANKLMKHRITFLFLFLCQQLIAQTEKEKLVGDWKFYLKDRINFEFLRLNSDGTGLKCFGETINSNDTLFINHITTLKITNWRISKGNLILESENTVSFKINPEFKLSFLENGQIELEGEHLIYSRYPSFLNRKDFQRSVTYQKSDKIRKEYGVNSASCIAEDRHLISLTKIDSATQIAAYNGFDDLIPHIISCNGGYEYTQHYKDLSYSLKIPNSIHSWSFGFGNKLFYISLNTDKGNISETSILIYYDFADNLKNFYFSEIEKGSQKKNIVRQNDKDIYLTDYDPDKFEGRYFAGNSIIIMYYTKDEKLQAELQKCITTFHYR